MCAQTRGLLHSQGLDGLQLGFRLCAKLLHSFPDIFPAKPKQRENALTWLTDNIQNRLDAAEDSQNLGEVNKQLEAFIEAVQERMNPGVNPLHKLASGVREQLERLGQTGGGDSEGSKTDRHETVAGPDSSEEASYRATPGATAGAIANRAQAFQQLEKVAQFLEKTEPHSPVHMLLRKAVAWGRLSMQEVLAELLAEQNSAREHVWEMLGVKEEDK